MNKIAYPLILSSLLFFIPGNIEARKTAVINAEPLCFLENKGQVRDQEGNVRSDIQYVFKARGADVFLGNGQIHYQFVKVSSCASDLNRFSEYKGIDEGERQIREWTEKTTSTVETYRMDVELIGANVNAEAVQGAEQPYFENYYKPDCEDKGMVVHSYNQVTYKDVYPGIDWVVYLEGGKFEHEFIIGKGADPSQIKLRYNGQTALGINNDGSITAATPMGVIREKAPVCYVNDGANKTIISGAFRLDGNILNYELGKYDGTLVIDPTVEWGTYYGWDSSSSPVYAMAFDPAADIYVCGLTYSNIEIASTGAYQYVYGGMADAYLVKFDSSGNRLWATYFGGDQGDWGTGVSIDNHGDVYLTGATGSLTAIATTGAYQTTYGGGEWDGYIAKFNPSGALQWATYYGGAGSDIPYSVSCDDMGHVYIAGFTNSSSGIATSEGFYTTAPGGYDDFLAQFDSSGNLKWGTFYGGPGPEYLGSCYASGFYVYLTGWTGSTTGIASMGSYQTVFGGGSGDAFVVKFDSSCNRLWASYYGGEAAETMGGITVGQNGDIYILGSTGSHTAIATTGCFQPTYGGGSTDAFLMKLDPEEGFKIWGTYFGGEDNENVDMSRIVTDDSDNILIDGYTLSTTGIASAGAWQTTYGGGTDDAFFAKFSTLGTEEWSTYYGGSNNDGGQAVGFDGKNIYLGGESSSPNNIATTGGFLPAGGAGPYYDQGFLVKFEDSDTSVSTLSVTQKGILQDKLSLYPSPNDGNFTLSGVVAAEGLARIIISDISGVTVWSGETEISAGALSRQVVLSSSLPAGTYTLRVVMSSHVTALDFVKE